MSLHAHSFEEMFGDIEKAGRATGALPRAKRLVAALRARVKAIAAKVRRAESRPRVFCMEWIDPVFTTGHWVPTMVRLAGAVDVLARENRDSRTVAWEDVVRAAPERLIIMPCGLSMSRAARDARVLPSRPGWASIPAVREGHVYVTEGPSYFNGSGPRLVDGVEILAAIAHPERIRRRSGFRRLRF